MGANRKAETAYSSGVPEFTRVYVAFSLVLCVVFCRSFLPFLSTIIFKLKAKQLCFLLIQLSHHFERFMDTVIQFTLVEFVCHVNMTTDMF